MLHSLRPGCGGLGNYHRAVAHQSLYRRYRPGRFADLVGQQHVVAGLRNAVRDGRSGHAYLFSGPRGTGKTSTARILARALNCTDLTEGEPCGACEACLSIQAGTSYDLFELDAASNNKVEDVRELISRVAIGSPGRTKVYILDEVHMLSTAASNALLKTLEEPPEHVTFVLATTDPQKVLPTIRSRTQHFEFGLVPAAELERHLRWVIDDAGLQVDEEALAWVVRKSAGSVRDALSALDQVAAVGGVGVGAAPLDELLDALCARDAGRALVGLASALASGREPRLVAEELLGRLRDAFLAAVAPGLSQLPDLEAARMAELATRLGTAGVTRALEAIGAAVLEMRQAPDARVALEVALVRLTRAELDSSVAALTERVARLEAALAAGAEMSGSSDRSPAPARSGGPGSGPSSIEGPVPAAPAGGDRLVPVTVGPDRSTEGGAPPTAAPLRQTPPREVREGAAAAARRQLAARLAATPPGARPASSPPGRPAPSGPPGSRPVPGSAVPPGPGVGPDRPAPDRPAPASDDSLEGSDRPPADSFDPGSAPPAGRALRMVSNREEQGSSAAPAPAPVPPAGAVQPPGAAGPPGGAAAGPTDVPSVAELSEAWASGVLDHLPAGVRALYRAGQFIGVEDGVALFALPSRVHRDRCQAKAGEVERSLAEHFGRPLPLRLVVDEARTRTETGGPPPADPYQPDQVADRYAADVEEYGEVGDVAALVDAPSVSTTGMELLQQTFPGAEIIE